MDGRDSALLSFTTAESIWLVVFRIDSNRYAVRLNAVERVARAVAVTQLPDAPALVLGIIDVAGQLLPVFDMRRRLRLTSRPISPADHMMIVRSGRRTLVLLIDFVEAVIERQHSETVPPDSLVAESGCIDGLIRFEDGLILIQDVDRFLSVDEEHQLDHALQSIGRMRD